MATSRPAEPTEEVIAVPTALAAGRARRAARRLATALGFAAHDAEAIALATSELATNLARYAQGGAIVLRAVVEPARRGLRVESHDSGPGIPSLGQAMRDGFSTGGGLGGGLGGVRRLMDDFEITTAPDGTHVVATKWLTLAGEPSPGLPRAGAPPSPRPSRPSRMPDPPRASGVVRPGGTPALHGQRDQSEEARTPGSGRGE
jgi:serine/threonine-protein kinase RsbT